MPSPITPASGVSGDRMVFEAKANTLAARIAHLYPQLGAPAGNTRSAQGDAAKDFSEGFAALRQIVGDYCNSLILNMEAETGARVSRHYFNDGLDEAFGDIVSAFEFAADDLHHETEEA